MCPVLLFAAEAKDDGPSSNVTGRPPRCARPYPGVCPASRPPAKPKHGPTLSPLVPTYSLGGRAYSPATDKGNRSYYDTLTPRCRQMEHVWAISPVKGNIKYRYIKATLPFTFLPEY